MGFQNQSRDIVNFSAKSIQPKIRVHPYSSVAKKTKSLFIPIHQQLKN